MQFVPGKSHRVRSFHFAEDSFSSTTKLKRLKPGAITTIFNGYPTYLTNSEGTYRKISKYSSQISVGQRYHIWMGKT